MAPEEESAAADARQRDGGAAAAEDWPPAEPLAVETVLVPVDGTDDATEAAEFAISVADRYDASVHAVYVLGRSVARAVERDAIDEDAVADEARTYLDELRALAEDADVALSGGSAYGYSSSVKRQQPGSVILDTAEEVDADFLVVPREPHPESERDTLARAAEYVLQYASQPVLSV